MKCRIGEEKPQSNVEDWKEDEQKVKNKTEPRRMTPKQAIML